MKNLFSNVTIILGMLSAVLFPARNIETGSEGIYVSGGATIISSQSPSSDKYIYITSDTPFTGLDQNRLIIIPDTNSKIKDNKAKTLKKHIGRQKTETKTQKPITKAGIPPTQKFITKEVSDNSFFNSARATLAACCINTSGSTVKISLKMISSYCVNTQGTFAIVEQIKNYSYHYSKILHISSPVLYCRPPTVIQLLV